jgi:hypothetical protein
MLAVISIYPNPARHYAFVQDSSPRSKLVQCSAAQRSAVQGRVWYSELVNENNTKPDDNPIFPIVLKPNGFHCSPF